MTTQAPWTDRDILDRLRSATFDSVTAEDLRDAAAEIERLRGERERIAQAIEAMVMSVHGDCDDCLALRKAAGIARAGGAS